MTTLIIGGGLSGLALADSLQQDGHDFHLIEARDRLGGRILTRHHGKAAFDMGPAWFWPGQPRMAALLDRLQLEKFDQHAEGILTFEDERGRVERGRGFASMQGSWRVAGGLGALIQNLSKEIDPKHVQMNATVQGITQTKDGISATLADGTQRDAERVVLAMPPRLAGHIAFSPSLPNSVQTTLENTPTWMAGQAKAIAVYDRPFWRTEGLSGDAMSRFGPMVEIHDASPADSGPFALFGFIGVPPSARQDIAALRTALRAQLARLFGPEAENPSELFVKDWADDPMTATPADQRPLMQHPAYGMPPVLRNVWDTRLHFSGTEVASDFGGYLEGALEAAEATAQDILQTT